MAYTLLQRDFGFTAVQTGLDEETEVTSYTKDGTPLGATTRFAAAQNHRQVVPLADDFAADYSIQLAENGGELSDS
jgi:hypothetical protein